MDRIFFDANEGDGEGRYDLGLAQSRRDLEGIEDLHDGLRVVIYMTDELELEAVLEFDSELDAWMAKPIEGTVKYHPMSSPTLTVEFQAEPKERQDVQETMTNFARCEGFDLEDLVGLTRGMDGLPTASLRLTRGTGVRIEVHGYRKTAGNYRVQLHYSVELYGRKLTPELTEIGECLVNRLSEMWPNLNSFWRQKSLG